jgi:thioesterase domain-containing protein
MPAELLDDPALGALDAHYRSMPPVAALQLRIAGYDGERLRLRAPLQVHVNDKGCAFGGSLGSMMTLAGWGLVTLRLGEAGLAPPVFVADSNIRYRAPLYADLEAEAWLEGGDWEAVVAELRERGRASVVLEARVATGDGGVAAEGRARYVALVG